MRRAMLILILLLGRVYPALTQLTSLSATHVTDPDGNLLANGIIRFIATDGQHHPISFRLSGESRELRTVECRVVRGAITESVRGGPCQLADSSQTDPPGVCYDVAVIDGRTRQEFSLPVGCYLPKGVAGDLDKDLHQLPNAKATITDNLEILRSINHLTADYVNRNIPGSGATYPYQVPNYNRYQSNGMRSLDDFFVTFRRALLS